ncbi:unnamed protein product [Dibothriocephalus latus]|uniref:Ionotropic glutamate receptor C-terminal domain-containing protein n=1 Tax=Dibothriocephalus latus TaxID=60516 RepID=A0A3P6TQM8_DIBLA|nr:unnamed protein product [Dibothriocephalus latus]
MLGLGGIRPTNFTTSSSITEVNNTLNQTWVFRVYTRATFNATSTDYITVDTNGQVAQSLPNLKADPTFDQLLDAARQSTFRVGIQRDLDMIAGPYAAVQPLTTDFHPTAPFYSEQFNFFYKKPTLSASRQIFQFVVAFDGAVWVLIFVAAVVVAAVLTLAHYLSPNRLDYSIFPSLMFTFAYLFQGIKTRTPNRLSSQIVVVVWWFFCLIFIGCFVSNYAAYISFTALTTLPNDPPSLLQQKEYSYGFIKGSTTEYFLSTSTDKDLRAIYDTVIEQYPQNVVPNRTVGVEKVTEVS